MKQDGVLLEDQWPLSWYLLAPVAVGDSLGHSTICPLRVTALL